MTKIKDMELPVAVQIKQFIDSSDDDEVFEVSEIEEVVDGKRSAIHTALYRLKRNNEVGSLKLGSKTTIYGKEKAIEKFKEVHGFDQDK